MLLAMSASAGPNDDYQPPTPMTSESSDSYDAGAESSTAPAPTPTVGDGAPAPSYDAPTYLYVDTPGPVAEVTEEELEKEEKNTPAPVDIEATSAPTAYYVEITSIGGEEKTPTDPVYGDDEETEEEEMPMENPTDGASCSTYDEDVSATYMTFSINCLPCGVGSCFSALSCCFGLNNFLFFRAFIPTLRHQSLNVFRFWISCLSDTNA